MRIQIISKLKRTRRVSNVESSTSPMDVPGETDVNLAMKKSQGWKKQPTIPTGWMGTVDSVIGSSGTDIILT